MPNSAPFSQLRTVDKYVAERVRGRRTLLRLTEENVAYRSGVTRQEYLDIEAGNRRIGAAMIFELSMILGVPVRFFFEGYPSESGLQAWAAL